MDWSLACLVIISSLMLVSLFPFVNVGFKEREIGKNYSKMLVEIHLLLVFALPCKL
jgi:hypothetical protein